MTSTPLAAIQRRVWEGRVPIEVRLAPSESRTFDQGEPYIVSCPRISYLPLLLPRLLAFFGPCLVNDEAQASSGWFECQDMPVKWHHPVGLLYDFYSAAQPAPASRESQQVERGRFDEVTARSNQLPWKLTVHFNDFPEKELVKLDDAGKVLIDSFMNSVKEADFLRNGTAKKIMTLSKEDSSDLWQAVAKDDFGTFQRIYNMLVPTSQPLRHVPIRLFLPSLPGSDGTTLRVVQSLIPAHVDEEVQTVGSALHSLVPSLFPSTRILLYARPILHGTVVPLTAPLEELLRCAAYADGWLNVVITSIG